MKWKILENIKFVFVTREPKSETIFLQMILDPHPEISCPPEHYLYDLPTEKLPEFSEIYNQSVIFKEIEKFIIKPASYKGAKRKWMKDTKFSD